MWRRVLPLLLLLSVACDSPASLDGGADAAPDAGPPTCTVLTWDPESGNLDRWPETALVTDDATTETGHRLRFDEEDYPVLVSEVRGYVPVFTEDLAELDGFGTTAPAYFTFGRAFDAAMLPSGPQAEASSGVGLAVVSAPGSAEPELRVATVEATDEGRTLVLAPSTPLPARALIAAFVTRTLTAAAGGCLEPSEAMAAELAAPNEDMSAAIAALIELGAITSASDLVALTVYPTQSIEEDTLAVAADIAAAEPPAPASAATCTEEALFRRCEVVLPVGDYRDEDGVFRRAAADGASAQRTYDLPLTFWLPLEGEGPYPTFLFGHGLTGDRSQAERLARFAAPLGLATVAAPAIEHGAHPANESPNPGQIDALLNFFAIGDLTRRALHAARLRDNFRQTVWDRLQVTRYLEQSPDIDVDGEADVDGAQLLYLGVSLGGLMGPELLAATDAYGAAVLVVPGGRISTIISDSAQFSMIIRTLRPNTTEGDVARFFPVMQTVLDAGDPAAYGGHVLERRFDIAPEPVDVLVGVVLDDDTVPNVANYTLGRAMRVPIVEPLLRPEPGFEVVTGPVMSNFANGSTGGLLQFDRISDGSGGTRAATHSNIGDSDVGVEAWLDFLTTHLDGATRIRDPYEAAGL